MGKEAQQASIRPGPSAMDRRTFLRLAFGGTAAGAIALLDACSSSVAPAATSKAPTPNVILAGQSPVPSAEPIASLDSSQRSSEGPNALAAPKPEATEVKMSAAELEARNFFADEWFKRLNRVYPTYPRGNPQLGTIGFFQTSLVSSDIIKEDLLSGVMLPEEKTVVMNWTGYVQTIPNNEKTGFIGKYIGQIQLRAINVSTLYNTVSVQSGEALSPVDRAKDITLRADIRMFLVSRAKSAVFKSAKGPVSKDEIDQAAQAAKLALPDKFPNDWGNDDYSVSIVKKAGILALTDNIATLSDVAVPSERAQSEIASDIQK